MFKNGWINFRMNDESENPTRMVILGDINNLLSKVLPLLLQYKRKIDLSTISL